MLLEGGKPAEAIAPLRQAVQLAPNPALIQIMLGQALVASNDRAHLDEAVAILQAALIREPESSDAYSQLAMAYGQKNDLAHADLASAQAAFMRGDLKTAREIATRAKMRFPVGSPGWVKADDIASYKPPQSALQQPLTRRTNPHEISIFAAFAAGLFALLSGTGPFQLPSGRNPSRQISAARSSGSSSNI